MTPSEETRGEKRVGNFTRIEIEKLALSLLPRGTEWLLGQVLDAAFSREAEGEKLRAAIVWALGAGDSFRLRGDDEGAYWWRSELAQRAGGWGLIKVWPEYPQVGAALLTAEGQKKGEG